MSSPARKPSCLKQRCSPEPESKVRPSNPGAALGSIGGTSEMLPYAQANVHFPTAKRELVKTRVTHSPASYDRSPIVVMPNSCAMPARGCPGRTYDPAPVSPSGRTIHPSAPRIRRPSTPFAVPGLVPDEGSSDDSDGLISPPPERTMPMFGTPSPTDEDDRAMMFAAARSSPKSKSKRSSRELRTYSGFSPADEGCLGGF